MNATALPYIMSTVVPPLQKSPDERPNILVADDEDQILNVVSKLVTCEQYGAITARDGNEALALYQECPEEISAVITDLNMPGMSGLELSLRIRDTHPDIPILIMSGNFEETIVRSLMQCRGYYLLRKPFTVGQFRNQLDKMMPNKRTAAAA